MIVYEAVESLELVLKSNDSCANLSFYIGFLKMAIGMENEAVDNFSFAIDKSEENLAFHFVWKGLAIAMSERPDQS